MNLFWTSCELFLNFSWTSYKLRSISQSSYEILASFLQTYFKHFMKFLQAFYKLLSNILWSSYKIFMNFLQKSYKLPSKALWTSWAYNEFPVNVLKISYKNFNSFLQPFCKTSNYLFQNSYDLFLLSYIFLLLLYFVEMNATLPYFYIGQLWEDKQIIKKKYCKCKNYLLL